jgi:adenosylhomocysteine nucleosidase
MESIGLIAAMPQESEALLRCIKGRKRTALGSFRGFRFQIIDRNCLLIISGMGLKRAMDATRSVMAEISPHLLVSFGIAGSINNNLQIGDVVVSGNSCLLDRGLPGQFQPLASLSEKAWNAATRVLKPDGALLVSGTAITTPGSQVILQGMDKMASPVLEMETWGIAQVAAEKGIPLVSIRSVSDRPQSPIPFNLETILDENDNIRIGKLLMMVLRRPLLLFQSRQMMQNFRKAANNAAKVLVAVLSQTSPVISP